MNGLARATLDTVNGVQYGRSVLLGSRVQRRKVPRNEADNFVAQRGEAPRRNVLDLMWPRPWRINPAGVRPRAPGKKRPTRTYTGL